MENSLSRVQGVEAGWAHAGDLRGSWGARLRERLWLQRVGGVTDPGREGAWLMPEWQREGRGTSPAWILAWPAERPEVPCTEPQRC